MSSSNLTGFLTYDPARGLESIGPEFIHDFDLLSEKIYKQYKLKISLDDFTSKSLLHVCRSLGHYDPTRSISTFIFSIIWQVAHDTDKAMRREVFESAEDLLVVMPASAETESPSIPKDLDIDFRRGLYSLAQELYKNKIWLNQERVYFDFLAGTPSPIVNAILWDYVLDFDASAPRDLVVYDVLERIAAEMDLCSSVVLSLYSVLGNDLFFVVEVLKGHKLKVSKTFSTFK